MTRSLAIICEARADRDTACALADRILCAEIDWITPGVLDDYRQWRGLLESESFLVIQRVPTLARQKNIRIHGKFDGNPVAPDEHLGRLALLLLYSLPSPPDGILLIRDDDGQIERRYGLEQARSYARQKLREIKTIVLGLAHPKRECWVLAGFDPRDEDERKVLETVRHELGFNPCTNAENLTAKHDQDAKSAKRVLRALTCDDSNRQEDCWTTADLGLLQQRGQNTGLAAYLDELQSELVPLFR